MVTGDGGVTWTPQTSGTPFNLYSVVFTDTNSGWAAGVGGTLLHTSNGGITWAPQSTGSTMVLADLAFVDATHGWALEGRADDGRSLLVTSDGGSTWQRISIGATDPQAWSLATAGGQLWIVGTDGMILSTVSGDTTAPTSAASGAVKGWYRKPAVVTFTASDTGSGVRTVLSRINVGPWVEGGRCVIPAPTNHSNDGEQTVSWKATDWAGNTQKQRTCLVRIDTRRPNTFAPHKSIVQSGRYVTLRYKVTDLLPCSGKATVTIYIKNLSGKTVQTLKLGSRTINRLSSYRFRCTLAKKTYRFCIYAVDSAGNKQNHVATNKLVVN